jgi:hypothetical protein
MLVMINIIRRINKQLLIVPLCISSCAMSGCLESSFDLASESRLPELITLPSGFTRADVSVTLNLYSAPWPYAKFISRDWKGKKLGDVNGKTEHPSYLPFYDEIVVVSGVSEIIAFKPYSEHEHMTQNGIPVALFYVVDDSCARDEGFEGGLPMCSKNEMNLNSKGCPCLIDPTNPAAASGSYR